MTGKTTQLSKTSIAPEMEFGDWRDLETYVHDLLVATTPALRSHGMEVSRQKRLTGHRGTWAIDVAYQFDILGVRHLVLIECKCYSRKVTRKEATYFLASVTDLAASKGLLVSNQQFTSGAMKIAEGTPVLLLSSVEFFRILESDLSRALEKELLRQIIDMRDEAIWISKKYGLEGVHGRFFQIQRILSEYVDFPHRFPLPTRYSTQHLDDCETTEQYLNTRIEYLVTVIDNIRIVRKDYEKRFNLKGCEYTNYPEST